GVARLRLLARAGRLARPRRIPGRVPGRRRGRADRPPARDSRALVLEGPRDGGLPRGLCDFVVGSVPGAWRGSAGAGWCLVGGRKRSLERVAATVAGGSRASAARFRARRSLLGEPGARP